MGNKFRREDGSSSDNDSDDSQASAMESSEDEEAHRPGKIIKADQFW